MLTLESIGLSGGNALRLLESPNFAGLEKIRFKLKPAADLPAIAKDIARYMSKASRDRHGVMIARLHGAVEEPSRIAEWLNYAKELSPLAMGVELTWHPDSIDIVMRGADATDGGKLSVVEVATWGTAPFIKLLGLLRNIDRLTITSKGDKPLSKPEQLAAAIEAMGVKAKNVTLPPEWKKALKEAQPKK
jgi:hypothetical protein